MHANFVHRHAMWSSNAIKQGRAAGLHDEAEAINNIEDSERPTMLALVYDSQYAGHVHLLIMHLLLVLLLLLFHLLLYRPCFGRA